MNNFLQQALDASLLVQLVMIILILLSIWCWVIIYDKTKELSNILDSTNKFDLKFWSGMNLNEFYNQIKYKKQKTPIESIFYEGWHTYLSLRIEDKDITPDVIPQTSLRAMRVAISIEAESLENNIQALATIASVSPYIGLLGTVWGIMNSFQSLSETSQTTLAQVAPGISEALIATALGLITAIPAVVAYNKFNKNIEIILLRYENFSERLTGLLQKEHMPEKIVKEDFKKIL